MIGWLYRLGDWARRRARGSGGAALGPLGEDIAHRFLERRGLTVVARNYRPPSGEVEIDIVARRGEALVFVEVKARSSGEFGPPDRAVDGDKQGYLVRAARDYARRAGVGWEHVRFDVVSVVLTRPPRIDWIEDAFR
jgi:putative endonuclease